MIVTEIEGCHTNQNGAIQNNHTNPKFFAFILLYVRDLRLKCG